MAPMRCYSLFLVGLGVIFFFIAVSGKERKKKNLNLEPTRFFAIGSSIPSLKKTGENLGPSVRLLHEERALCTGWFEKRLVNTRKRWNLITLFACKGQEEKFAPTQTSIRPSGSLLM